MKHLQRGSQIASFVGLGLGAIWLRLRHLGYTEFWGDQALTLNMALEWVHGGDMPLASMKSSFGVFNPPLVEYLYALPLLIKPDLMGVVWLVALINLLGLAVAGWATVRVFGWRVGWWATVLFTVNPWAVYYGRLIWMQSFVPGFSALCYACTLLYLTQAPRWRYVVVGALSLAAVVQVHLTSIILIPVIGFLGLCLVKRPSFWHIGLGGSLFVASFAPFIVFQFRTHFADWEALRAGLSRPAEINLAPWLILLDLLQSKGIYSTLGTAAERWRALDGFGSFTDASLAVLITLALGWAIVSVLRQATTFWARRAVPMPMMGQLVLVIWLVVPVLSFLRHTQYLQNYYFLYLFPIPFILLALFADQVYQWLRGQWAQWPVGRWAALVAFAPLGLIAAQQARLDVLGQNLAAAGVAGQQRILDVQQAITTSQRLMASRPACQLVVVTEGAQYESSRFALLREFVGRNRTRFAEAGAGYLLPQPCAVYFHATAEAATQRWLETTARPLPDATIHTPEQTWTFFDLPSADREQVAARWQSPVARAEWRNGLQLRGLTLGNDAHPGTTVDVHAVWAVTQATPPEVLHFGQYLLTSTDSIAAQADGPGLDSAQWQPGDVFQTTFQLALPPDLTPGAYTLAMALYHYPQIENVPLLNSDGTLLRLDTVIITQQP